MPKSASPIRLQADLMHAATVAAKRYDRSTAEQIEYWVDLGRRIASKIDPDTLLSITAGLATIKVEPVNPLPINPESVFASLEKDRQAGSLPSVTSSAIQYQISESHPRYLVQVDENNHAVTGQFVNGEFIPLNDSTT